MLVGTADSIASKRFRVVSDSQVIAICVVEAEDDIAKQVGSEAEQLGSEAKHEVVESADDMTKQVRSRWK